MKHFKNQTGQAPSTPAPAPTTVPSSGGGGMSSNESIEKGITPTK